MPTIQVQIVRYTDDHFPGRVECLLIDAEGKPQVFIEKVPVVSLQSLSASSSYPCSGAIACEVESAWIDDAERSLARVNTERPWGIASSAGETKFLVLASQLTD